MNFERTETTTIARWGVSGGTMVDVRFASVIFSLIVIISSLQAACLLISHPMGIYIRHSLPWARLNPPKASWHATEPLLTS